MSNNSIVSSLEGLKSYVGNVGSITPVSWDDVSTVISLDNPVLNSYIHVLYSMMGHELYVNSGQEIESLFTEDDFIKYIRFILKERVKYVRGEKVNYRPTDRSILVPGFISLILEQIGEVSDDDLGLRLFPSHSEEESLSYESAKVLARKLASFEKFGFSFSRNYSREKKGDWEFMMMSVATDSSEHPNCQVLGVDPKVHGVKAVLASVVLWRTGVLDALTHRVSYGTTGFFSGLVDSFAEPRKS